MQLDQAKVPTNLENVFLFQSSWERDCLLLWLPVKLPLSFRTEKPASRSITKSEEMLNSPSVLSMFFPLLRPTSTTECFMTSRADSPLCPSRRTNPNTSFWRWRPKPLEATRSHTLWPTTAEPSDSPTPKSNKETPSSMTLRRDRFPPGSRTNPENLCTWPEVTTSVELVPWCTSRSTWVVSTSPTSEMPMERLSPPETPMCSWSVTARSQPSPSPKEMVSTSASLKRNRWEKTKGERPANDFLCIQIYNHVYSSYHLLMSKILNYCYSWTLNINKSI